MSPGSRPDPGGRGTTVLLTGMSGTGKSAVLAGLRRRGWQTVDTDVEGLVEERTGRTELRVAQIRAVLRHPRAGQPLVVAAIGEGQGQLYPHVHHVVLLTAPWPVLQQRLQGRSGNDFGKGPGELERVRADQEAYEPLLRQGADLVIDTSAVPLTEVVDRIDGLAATPDGRGAGR